MSSTTCPTCEVNGEVVLGGPTEVSVGTVAAVLERRPTVACPSGHGATPTEVVGAAMATVEEVVPRARSRFLRADVCSHCATELTMPVRRTDRAVTVSSELAPVVTLRLDLPVTRCPSCGLDQVPSRSQEDLVVVVPALYAAES